VATTVHIAAIVNEFGSKVRDCGDMWIAFLPLVTIAEKSAYSAALPHAEI